MDKEQVTIAPAWAGQRLDKAVSGQAPHLSRALVQRLIGEGLVERAGVVVASPSDKVRAGEVITLHLPAPQPARAEAEAIPLVVVYEDAHLAVIDKPAGLTVHPGAGQPNGTLVNALLHHCTDLSGIGGELRPGIVHRLDKETSGLLVIAKHDQAHRALAAQFQDHSAYRRYLAVVKGLPPRQGTIDAPLGRHPVQRQRMAVATDGRRAVTHYQVLEPLGPFTLIACRLETGRTHQIRVHLAHLHHPLLGDPVYSRPYIPPLSWPEEARQQVQAFQRQALHAAELTFTHPVTGQKITCQADPPPDFQRLLETLRAMQ